MNFKNYTKLLLILGLFAAVPAQGMSYVNYVKSFFVKEADSEKAQREENIFRAAIKSHDYEKALTLFEKVSEKTRSCFLKIVLTAPEDSFESERDADFVTNLFAHKLTKECFKKNDTFAVEFFLLAVKLTSIQAAFIAFKEASVEARIECCKAIIPFLSTKSLLDAQIITAKILNIDPSYKSLFGDRANCLTQTVKHMVNNSDSVREELMAYVEDCHLEAVLNKVVEKEQEYEADYYTFVHAQSRKYYLPEKLYTLLWSIKKRHPLKNFLFVHVKDLVETEQQKAEEKIERTFMMTNGGNGTDREDEKKVLFMNYAFFANTAWIGGTSSARLLKENHNFGAVKISLQDPFRIFGYQHIYKKFSDEIEALANEYNTLSKYGNIIFIAVPKEKIHKYVYASSFGAPRKRVIIDFEDIGREYTSDIRKIMHALLNKPSSLGNTDSGEFCMIMSQAKGGMDPETGIKIIPIVSGDPAKLAELQKKEDALFAKIKAAIEEEENVKATAVNRANAIVNHLVMRGKESQGIAPAKTMARINNIMGHIQPQEQN